MERQPPPDALLTEVSPSAVKILYQPPSPPATLSNLQAQPPSPSGFRQLQPLQHLSNSVDKTKVAFYQQQPPSATAIKFSFSQPQQQLAIVKLSYGHSKLTSVRATLAIQNHSHGISVEAATLHSATHRLSHTQTLKVRSVQNLIFKEAYDWQKTLYFAYDEKLRRN